MSTLDGALPSSARAALTLRTILAAWRGITRRQVLATGLLGFALHVVVVANGLTGPGPILFGTGLPGFLLALCANEVKAFAVLLAVAIADHVTGGDPARRGAYGVAVTIGALIGAALAMTFMSVVFAPVFHRPVHFDFDVKDILYIGLEVLLYGAAAVTIMLDRREAVRARDRMHAAELERIAARRRSAESDLQALQARVEPQFLFRTLAEVARLYGRDTAQGERTLDELIAYLRAAMPRTRDTSSTLGQELQLARAYLEIATIISGGRLTHHVEAPPEAESVRLPPMILLPLLDDAVSRTALLDAGPRAVRVRVALDGAKLELEVAHTADTTHASGDDEIRATIGGRIEALYGADASVQRVASDGGTTAAIVTLPVERSPSPDDGRSRHDAHPGPAPGRASDITMMTRTDARALPVALTSGTQGWFAGLGWKPVAFVLIACLVNGLRRNIQDSDYLTSAWLLGTLEFTAFGVIIAIPVMLALAAAYNLASPRPALRYGLAALAVIASTMLGVAAAMFAEQQLCVGPVEACFGDKGMLTAFVQRYLRYGTLCAAFAIVFVYLRIAEESTARSHEAEVDRARFVQRMEEARLRMLRAQIEPHFLFNTLANVRRLYQTARADGAAMLDHLMRYLEVALPQMRAETSTLDREAELTRSYLEIQRLRMGHRLQFRIDIPPSLRTLPVPPIMLVTLAENAIKHGLAPLPEGGGVEISAAVQGAELHVRVADSGQGFIHTSGAGTGLANIRARLAGIYGAAARLSLGLNTPRGVVATLALPFSPTGAPRPSPL